MAERGGIAATAHATGISVPTIRKGIAELQAGERLEPERMRRRGGGRKRLTDGDATLLEDLERAVDADRRGDPGSLLRWTSKRVRHLAEGCGSWATRLTSPPSVARRAVERGQPVISVDTKKKELVGDFKNAGREWRPTGEPELVRVHDFKDKQLGEAIPHGIYDLRTDEGWSRSGSTTTPPGSL